MKYLAIALCAGLAPLPCAADDFKPGTFANGDHLYAECQNNNAGCESYLKGIIDSEAYFISTFGVNKDAGFCVTQQASIEQIRDIVVEYLRNHPDYRRYAAASLAMTALKAAFPCQGG
jgi:hypothetical protein